jgi:hypothetical protein
MQSGESRKQELKQLRAFDISGRSFRSFADYDLPLV